MPYRPIAVHPVTCIMCSCQFAYFSNDEHQWRGKFYQSIRFPTVIIHGGCLAEFRTRFSSMTGFTDEELQEIPFVQAMTPLIYDIRRDWTHA